MPMTFDDDIYDDDFSPSRDDDGPALRPGYVPLPPLENGGGTGGLGLGEEDPEPFLTLRDPSRSTIDRNRFVRPATPEEIKAYDEWEERRAKLGMGAVIEQVFADRRQAWEQTPKEAAYWMWLERQTGIPQRMLKDPDVLRTAKMRAQMGLDALTLHDAPEQVVSWLKTPGMLEIARDDLETLKKLGDALQRLAASRAPTRPGSKWKDFQSGIADVLEGKADVREMKAAARMSPSVLEPEADVGVSSGVMGLGRGFLASLPKEVRKDVAASMSRAALSNAAEWRSWAEWVRPEPYVLPKEGTFSRWLSDVVRGTPYSLTGMPVSAALTTGGAVLGGPAGATAGAALSSLIQTNGEAQTEQAQVWKQLVARGMDPAEAYDKSFNEVYLPNFGLLYLSNFLQDRLTFGVPLGKGAAYWLRRGGNLLLSSLFEGGEEIGQSLISNRALGEENDWGRLLYEGAVGVGVGLVFGGGGTALDTAMGRYREHRAEAAAARESARFGAVMDEAVKAAEASRVRERSPEAFDDFVEYVSGQGQEKVNVDGAVFFQTFGEDAYAAAERLGIAEGLDEAARTGGAVEIPTAAILKNPDLYEKVKNDLRYSDDGMSRNEAREFERTRDERNRADIDAAASAMRTVQEAGEKAERIRDGLRAQFEALGHKKVGKREAEFYSTIWTAALANEARYAGVDIEEMARRPEWNLRFQYDRGTGDISMMQDVYSQPINAGVDLGQKVPILDLSSMEGTGTPKELLVRLKDMALNGETWISRDAEVFATLPRGKKLKHVAYSSRKAQIDGVMALTRRNSVAGSLDDLVQNAVLIESTPNNDPKKTDVLNFHRLYVPVRTDAGVQTVRIVAEELKGSDRLRPTEVEIYDVVLEGQKESLGVPNNLLAKEGVTAPGAPFELTIADMLRGVKDAEGNPYVGEEYQQSSARQSEEYDPGDPKTWPAGPARDEALVLEAWQNLENDDEPETWPESPEKTEALALQKEYGEIEAWVESHTVEEVLANDELNERGVAIEKRLRDLRKELRKKKPKGAERRLLQLIEAEEEAAAREAETYYQTTYQGSPHRGIKKMSLKYIGTGEGSLAYGYGMYSAGNRDVAQDYRVALGGAGYTVGGRNINLLIEKAEQGRDYVMAEVLGEIAGSHKTIGELRQEYTKENGYDDAGDYQKALDKVERQGLKGDGQLYRLEVPENDVLLDWDAPFSKQPEKVKTAIREIAAKLTPEDIEQLGGNPDMLLFDEMTGQQLYAMLAWLPSVDSEKAASMLLLKHGIPGLRYLDGNSRNKGEGTHNFVIWDEDAMSIEETYYQRQGEEKLAQDEKAWAETVDNFIAGKLIQNRPVRVMTTPIALILAADEDVGFKEIVTSPAVLKKILEEKHVDVTPEILKQLPRAMADPILVFKSATVPGSYVSMLELKDSTGGTVVVPVALNASAPGKQAFMTSVYGKGNITQANNQWFAEQIESGNLRYINTKKSTSWARDVGLQLPIMSLPAEALHELNIPTEADLVKARGENPGYYQRQAEEKLAQDEKAWATLIDRFLDNNLSGREKGAPLPVMTTPLVLSLTGVEVLPVEIHARNLDKILNGKHEIAPETLKQIPRAIADPIMIFRSPADESKGRDSRVILTELTEKDADGKDRSIVAAITLERANTRYGYEINELTTVFRKDVSSRQNLTPELDVLDWMTRRHKDGSPMNLLLYLNRNKGLEWLDRTGTSPKASSLFQDPYVQSVPNEADLDNLRAAAPGFYQDAGTPLGSTRFGEAETIVTILKNGNRSTFLHELGHVFLNSRKNLALMEGIDETIRQDWTTLVEWLEVADIDFSKPLSEADEKRWRNAHEKFAAGFEKYLMEGKAPSLDLARAFRAFKKWLTDIYRAVRNVFYVDADGNRVEFEINDEIRGVMDRMLASEEEIDAETTIRELAVEEAALKEEIQRHEAKMREREAQERISAEGGEEWASLETPESAMEAVDGWLRELESYEIGRAARAEVRKTLEYIQEEGGLNFNRLVHLMGDEAAGKLRKKLGNFYFTSKKALTEGRGLPLDVLAEDLGMDENGLVAFLEGIEGGRLKKPAPLLEVNTDTLNALIDRLGVEGAQAYLKDRARYLTKQQKAIQQEYDKDKGNTQVKADLEATYQEQREVADGLRALEGTLKAEGDIAPEQVFEPVSLTTESGRSLDEADSSELLMLPDGSTELGRIDEDVAEAAGIAAGEIRANVGAVRHAEEGHGGEILGSGYPDVETFFFDVLSAYERVYRGSNDSLLLTKPLGGHHAVAAIELVNEDGVYRAKTGWTIRERKLNKKELLFARSEPLAAGPGAGVVSRTGPNKDREGSAPTAKQKSNSAATVPPGKANVNPMLTLSEAMRRGYAMAEKYARAAFRAGREEATLKARERMQLLKQKLQERQALKKEVNKLVKGINNMAKSESITWARHKELEKLLADYDLKRRRQETLDRRAELEEYLKENPEAADTMNAADLEHLGTKTLNDMTLDDLRTLGEQVRQIYDRGHEEYKVWDLERTERRDTIHSELVAVLQKRKTNLPKIVTKSEDLKKQYKGITGKLAKAKDWTYASTLGPDRFFDWLDEGATDYTGAFVRYLVDEVNKQRDVALRHIFERRKWMEDRLRPLGFRMSDFTRIAATVEGQDFTWDDIMEIYIGMRNDKKGRAILYGNLKNMDNPEGTAAYLIGLLSEDHKKAAELVVEDHNRNVDRIEAGLIDAFQKGMDRETDYTSIHRLEHLSSMGLIDAESAEALTDGMADAGVLRRVEDGFMKKRVEIKDENQTPVKLGLFSNWHEDVSRHEHAAAMATTARDIAGALLMRNPVDGQTIGRMVKERFGDEAWRTLVDFVNTNVTDDARLAHSLLDKMSNTMIKNMVIAYLAGNLGTVLKQTTSIPRFLITAGPHRILVSIAQFLTQGPKFLENVYELDPQMRDRMGSPILTMLRQDPRWGKRMYQRGLDWMLAPIAMMDRWVAAIGWKATYDANLKRLGHEGAVREAQRAVRLTQQPASAKDAARMWRQNGFVRLAMVFTSDAAQTFGMTAYDLVQQLRSGKLGRAFSTLTALALTGILVKAASEGLPDDEDDEDEDRSWVLEAFTEQFISSIPLVGKEAMVLYDNLSGKRRGSQYSAFITPVEKVARAWRLWADEDSDEEEFRRATWLALEAFSLSGVAPIPVTGMRRMVQSMELAEEDGIAAALNMVGIRSRE